MPPLLFCGLTCNLHDINVICGVGYDATDFVTLGILKLFCSGGCVCFVTIMMHIKEAVLEWD